MTQPSETSRPLVSHVSVGVTDVHRAGVFYDAVAFWDRDHGLVVVGMDLIAKGRC